MNEHKPVRKQDALDRRHEYGKRRSESVPELDVEKTVQKVRAAGQPSPNGKEEDDPGTGSRQARDAVRGPIVQCSMHLRLRTQRTS